jgi:hypothetical protein
MESCLPRTFGGRRAHGLYKTERVSGPHAPRPWDGLDELGLDPPDLPLPRREQTQIDPLAMRFIDGAGAVARTASARALEQRTIGRMSAVMLRYGTTRSGTLTPGETPGQRHFSTL